jgi:hypothetical protein
MPVPIDDYRSEGRALRLADTRLDDLWIATFGAAYADSVRHCESLAEASADTYPRPGGYETALDFGRARADVERAMTVANDAVRKVREWFNDGNGNPVDEDPEVKVR